jgi:hypothetical protein
MAIGKNKKRVGLSIDRAALSELKHKAVDMDMTLGQYLMYAGLAYTTKIQTGEDGKKQI